MALRLKIKEVAKEKGLSMTKISHRSEIAISTIRKMFNEPYRSFNSETLERIARVLGVSPLELLEYIPDENAPREKS